MKRLFSLLLLTLLLAACSPADSERLIGTWNPHTVTVDGKVLISLDGHMQQRAVDREWKRLQKEDGNASRNAIRQELHDQAVVLRGMNIRFEPNGKTRLETTLGANKTSLNGNWTIDENKHRLTISYGKIHPVVYRYQFRENELYLEHANSETIFRRAKN